MKQLSIDIPRKLQLFSMGNAKLPKECAIFNLLAVHDCVNCETCADTCYARFRQNTYAVHKSREINSQLVRKDLDLFIIASIATLKWLNQRKGVKYVRIHEAGDFINTMYYRAWRDIARHLPEIKFFAMTKNKKVCDVHRLLGSVDTNNLNIISSFIDGKRNYGSEQYCDKMVVDSGAYKCPDIDHKGVCLKTCTYCLTNDKPCFVIHGNLKGKDKYEKRVS